MEDGEAEVVLGVPVAPQLALLLVGLLFPELPQPDSNANVKLAPKMKNKRFGTRRGPM